MEIPHEEKMQIVQQITNKIYDSFKGFRITKAHQKKCAINCGKIIVSVIESHIFELQNKSSDRDELITKLNHEAEIYLMCIDRIKSI